MIRSTRRLLPLPLLMLAACDGGGTAPASNAAVPAPEQAPKHTDVQQRMAALPPRQLHGVLLRAIRDGDQDCQGVERTLRQPDMDGRPTWAARCTNGTVFRVSVDGEGTAQVDAVGPRQMEPVG